MTVISLAVARKKFLFGCANARLSDVGTSNFSFMLGILHVYRHAHVQSHVSPDMGCYNKSLNGPTSGDGLLLASEVSVL